MERETKIRERYKKRKIKKGKIRERYEKGKGSSTKILSTQVGGASS